MIIIHERELTKEEKKDIVRTKRAGKFDFVGLCFVIFFFAILVQSLLFIFVDWICPLSKNEEKTAFFIILFIALIFTIRSAITFLDASKKSGERPIAEIRAETTVVKTSRAIKREDPEDFGIVFYLDVVDKGKRKTLFLWGQYLDVLEYDQQFPNTHFEITRRSDTKWLMDIKVLGSYFKPEKVLPAFKDQKWEDLPEDGDLLEIEIEEI